MSWVIYPKIKPEISGYYMTYYYNPTHDQLLYKALWFNVDLGLWTGPWPWNYDYGEEVTAIDGKSFRPIIWKGIDVRKYQPNSRSDFYTQCELVKDSGQCPL